MIVLLHMIVIIPAKAQPQFAEIISIGSNSANAEFTMQNGTILPFYLNYSVEDAVTSQVLIDTAIESLVLAFSVNITGLLPARNYNFFVQFTDSLMTGPKYNLPFITNSLISGIKTLSTKPCIIDNPKNGFLKIHAPVEMIGSPVQVVNLLGQSKITTLLEQEKTVDLTSLPTGYYIVAVGSGAGQLTKRILVQ